jgi:hypothetical protein
MGVAGKVEQWHCPNCGGKVIPESYARMKAKGRAKAEAKREAVQERRAQAWLDIPDDEPIELVQLSEPNKDTLRAVYDLRNANKRRDKKAVREELGEPPIVFSGLEPVECRRLLFWLREAGAEVEIRRL